MNANNDDISNRLRASLGDREAPSLSADLVTGAAERPAPRLVHPARRAAIAGGSTLAVAAIAVSALVVTAPWQQHAPLFTAAGGAAAGTESAMSSDSRLMMWTNYEYVAGDGLSTDSGSGHVWQLQRVGTAESVLQTVADAFGVEGAPAKSTYYDPAYPTYVIGAEDGTAPNVTVSWAGTGDWWYSDPAAYPQYSCDSEGVCDEPAATENLAPSESEARAIAHDLFSATGFSVAAGDIRVVKDDWQTSASASLVVAGTQTALEWNIGWGTTGLISYAYGHSVKAVDRGEYGTVSAHDAVERLADGRWFGSAGPEYQTGVNILASDSARALQTGDVPDAPASDTPTSEPGSEPGDAGPSEPAPTEPTDPTVEPTPEPTLVDPVPVDPVPAEPETATVTVTEAHATLLLVWDANGDAWLVPGFAMPHPDGWFTTVISLVEGVITLPEPVEIEPYAVDTPELTN